MTNNTKLTTQQKLDALAAKFYQGVEWKPKAGDYYTSSRADLELYRVAKIENGFVYTEYCTRPGDLTEWPESDFVSAGFGRCRVHVPDWVMKCQSDSEQLVIDSQKAELEAAHSASKSWQALYTNEVIKNAELAIALEAAQARVTELTFENRELRKLLAVQYAGALLYCDDGELQDNLRVPFIDFSNDSPFDLQAKFRTRSSQSPTITEAAQPVQDGDALTFSAFRKANVTRCLKWHPEGIESWSPSDWLTAVTGELGELASLLKMRNRERDRLPGNKFSPTQKQIADEVADVLTYLDLLAEVLGVDLASAAIEKFNEVSERVGFPDRIPAQPSEQSPIAPQSVTQEPSKRVCAFCNGTKVVYDDLSQIYHQCPRCRLQPSPAVHSSAQVRDVCEWTIDQYDEHKVYESSCGETWSFVEGGVEENRVKFCQGCGKPVLQSISSEPTEGTK